MAPASLNDTPTISERTGRTQLLTLAPALVDLTIATALSRATHRLVRVRVPVAMVARAFEGRSFNGMTDGCVGNGPALIAGECDSDSDSDSLP